MKKVFFAGLSLLLPLVLTLLIFFFVLNLVTQPFVGLLLHFFHHYHWFEEPWFFIHADKIATLIAKIAALGVLAVVLVLVGTLGELMVLRYLGRLGNRLLHQIPIIKMVYKAIQEVVHTLFNSSSMKTTTFSSVVLVPFPHAEVYTLGFVMKRGAPAESNALPPDTLSVFVPGTPNPMMGFMLLFPSREVITLNIAIDDAIKFVVSCGVIPPTKEV